MENNFDDMVEATPADLATPKTEQSPALPLDLTDPGNVDDFLNRILERHPMVEVTPDIIIMQTPDNKPPPRYPLLCQRLANNTPIVDTPEEPILVPQTLLQSLQKISKNHSKRLLTNRHRDLKINTWYIKYKLHRLEAAIETELMAGQETPELLASMFMRQELEQFCASQQAKLITKLSQDCCTSFRNQNHKQILAHVYLLVTNYVADNCSQTLLSKLFVTMGRANQQNMFLSKN